jgi:CHAT domain-containing protein
VHNGQWKDLPATRAEVAQLANLFGPAASTLLDAAASEGSLERLRKEGALSKFKYIHLATHGELNDMQAFESALILAQDVLPATEQPSQDGPHIDGRLSAREVLDFWKLDAELVTLSACDTALGVKGGGDGPLGFSQAFLTAGSRAVCLSLWKVDDTATALLMGRFYQNLLAERPGLDQRMPKASALAEAKQWLRDLPSDQASHLAAVATRGLVRGSRGKDEQLKLAVPAIDPQPVAAKATKPFSNPYYWSAFVLVGDPN